MILTFIDLVTGETTTSDLDWSLLNWAENNGSCDCNRVSAFPKNTQKELLELKYGEHYCYGANRFKAIDVTGDLEGQSKEDVLTLVNQEYKTYE